MSSPAYEVAQYLAANSIGTFAGSSSWSISVAQEPVSPIDAITIYDTGGQDPDTDELDLLRPTFQVRVRSDSYPDAFSKHEAIRDLLILTEPITMSGATYVAVVMTSDIGSIGRDEGGRYLLVANYRAIKERT